MVWSQMCKDISRVPAHTHVPLLFVLLSLLKATGWSQPPTFSPTLHLHMSSTVRKCYKMKLLIILNFWFGNHGMCVLADGWLKWDILVIFISPWMVFIKKQLKRSLLNVLQQRTFQPREERVSEIPEVPRKIRLSQRHVSLAASVEADSEETRLKWQN